MVAQLRTSITLFIVVGLACSFSTWARKLEVGPGKSLTLPSQAASSAKDGDTIEIAPGLYPKDATTWHANSLFIRATAKYAHLRADGAHAGGKAIWVITGNDIVIENIEFSGATVPDENGAGIRSEGKNLTLRHCYFHDNENGILGDAGGGDMLIEYSEFDNNGLGDGYTHNMYILDCHSFTLRGCLTHHAKIGHNVKSRSRVNHILYNRITDDSDGTASYNIDLPNGGVAFIVGNLIQQSPNSDNPTMVAWGAEGLKYSDNRVYVAHNTLVNDMSRGTFILLSGSPSQAKAVNNLFVGPGTLISGKMDTAGNVVTQSPGFVDRKNFDYRLTANSPALDRGVAPNPDDTINLSATFAYVYPTGLSERTTNGKPDAGAYEFGNANPIQTPRSLRKGMGRVHTERQWQPRPMLFISSRDRRMDFLGQTLP